MEIYPIYVAGTFQKTSSPLDVINPHTGEVFAQTFQAGTEDFEKATQAALDVQNEMRDLPAHKKYEILRFLSDEITKDRMRLATVLAKEAGKPMIYALGEIDRAANTFLVAAEESKRLPGEEFLRLDWTAPGEGREGIVKQFPIGLVASIAPFNFPLNLAVHKIAPAIAAGCPIVLKPASSTPLSTLELAKLIDQTDLPKGAVSILPMNREVGNQLVTDERYKLLSFTGSPVVGWKMKAQAGKKKVVLELGGNAGVIISESADLEKAIPRCSIGGFAYAGQVCIHAQRFYVHRSHFDRFVEGLKTLVEGYKIGNPEDESTQFTSMIDEKNAVRVEQWVGEALEAGATQILGGARDGALYPATILTNVPKNTKVCCEEIFGPVIVVEPFDDFADAVEMINDSVFGLQAGVFTHDTREIDYAFRELEVGGVIHNDIPTFRVDHMPYGGVKDSGLGREGLKYAMADMLEPRILVQMG